MAEKEKKSFWGGLLGSGAKALGGRQKALQDAEDAAMGKDRPPMSTKWEGDSPKDKKK